MNTTLGDPKYTDDDEVFIIIDNKVVKVKIELVNPFGISYTFRDMNDVDIKKQNGTPLSLPESMVYASVLEAGQALEAGQVSEGILENSLEPPSGLNNSSNSFFFPGNTPDQSEQQGGIRRRRTIKKRSKKTRKTKKSKKSKKSRRRI
jgi:hypothetical protein